VSVIRTGRWVYSMAGLSLDAWAIVAQSEYDLLDQRLIWMWPDWQPTDRLAFDLAVEDGRVVKITGPAAQPPGQYWLYAKLAKYQKKPERRSITLRQAGLIEHRAMPEFA